GSQPASKPQHQCSVAGPQINHAPAWPVTQEFARHRGDDAGAAQDRVQATNVPSRAGRPRVVCRQDVQQFRLDLAHITQRTRGLSEHLPLQRRRWTAASPRTSFHSTSSKAPWQLNPAPNDESHHQPPGALSASAACITKYTDALLILPNSRNTAALHRKSCSVNPSLCCSASRTSRPPPCTIQAAI